MLSRNDKPTQHNQTHNMPWWAHPFSYGLSAFRLGASARAFLIQSSFPLNKATCIVIGGNADHLRPPTMSACSSGRPGNDTVGCKYDIIPAVYGGGLNKFRQGKAALHNTQPVNAEVKLLFPSTDYRNSMSP